MQNINWNGVRLRVQSYNVQVGTQQLELTRCFRQANGIPVVLVPGFLENTRVFLAENGAGGLAPFLASLGYDVYLAELRGKGNSWPSVSRRRDSNVHDLICEDLPAQLAMIDKQRPGEPQFWIGQGFGSLLLLGYLARNEQLAAPVIGLAHIAAARRCEPDSPLNKIKYRCWNFLLSFTSNFLGYAGVPLGDVTRREAKNSFQTLRTWHSNVSWCDPEDQFDYAAALQEQELPPSLYIANQNNALWGNASDCRKLISELGCHNGRMVVISKSGGNLRNYTSRGLLRHPMCCDDHFLQLHKWMDELAPNQARPNGEPAEMDAMSA